MPQRDNDPADPASKSSREALRRRFHVSHTTVTSVAALKEGLEPKMLHKRRTSVATPGCDSKFWLVRPAIMQNARLLEILHVDSSETFLVLPFCCFVRAVARDNASPLTTCIPKEVNSMPHTAALHMTLLANTPFVFLIELGAPHLGQTYLAFAKASAPGQPLSHGRKKYDEEGENRQ